MKPRLSRRDCHDEDFEHRALHQRSNLCQTGPSRRGSLTNSMRDVLCGSFAIRRWTFRPSDRVRVVNWNIDRGLRLEEIISFLDAQRADILVLQEVDLNARRTGFRNIAEEIAKRLGMNYAFAQEFQELGQGRHGSPAYHGQATLSRWPLARSRVIRFRRQSHFWEPRWFLPSSEPFQRRHGGRVALVSEAEISGRRLMLYNLHLESRGDNGLRIAQLAETLEDTKQYLEELPVVVAGDLNLDISRSYFSVEALERLGFHSAVALPVPHTTPPHGLFHRQRTIDWAYLAGPVRRVSGRVAEDVTASDHYPVSFDFTFTRI